LIQDLMGDLDFEIRIDTDEMGIKSCVVSLRQRNTVLHDRLTQLFRVCPR